MTNPDVTFPMLLDCWSWYTNDWLEIIQDPIVLVVMA